MIFRRGRRDQGAPGGDAGQPEQSDEAGESAAHEGAARTSGPWDSAEVALDEEDTDRVDLGALLVSAHPGVELRLQVDEASQTVTGVLLVGADGAVELRPFAAPRNADIWDELRAKIAAETARRGGTATPRQGTYGTELAVSMPVQTPDGQAATQPSRVVGVRGPRWLLRATFVGRPALEPGAEGALEEAFRDVVVVRGPGPVPPGEPLPLAMPGNAQPAPPPGV